MNKALEAIKDYASKLQQTMFGWQVPEQRKELEKLCKELDSILGMNPKYSLDDVLRYVAASITKPLLQNLDDDAYPTINFIEHEQQ